MATDIYQLPGDHMDLDLPYFGDDLPEGEAFPVASQQSSDPTEILHSTSTASAPMRRKARTVRVLPTDANTTLGHQVLADWNANYLENMAAASKEKNKNRVTYQAKKDAEQFLWGGGMGGIVQQFAGLPGPTPFDMFMGDNFFEFVTGESRTKAKAVKHDRDSGIDDVTQGESRNVRQKTNDPDGEFGRGMDDDAVFLPGDDDIELPREGATALNDEQIFSAMPWNSVSRHGSSVVPGGKRPGFVDAGRSSRPGSRMVTPTPLPQPPVPLNFDSEAGGIDMGDDEYPPSGPSSPPTVIGAPSHVSTQMRDALPTEDGNFLDFVMQAIIEKRDRAQAQLDPVMDAEEAEATFQIKEVTLEELLPPQSNNTMIACQGLLMVLTLGTKGLLDVQQDEHFGSIRVKWSAQAQASQVVEISDGEDGDDEDPSDDDDVQFVKEQQIEEEEMSDEEQLRVKQEPGQAETEDEDENEGYFEEQFAAGHTAPEEEEEEEERDSLYGD